MSVDAAQVCVGQVLAAEVPTAEVVATEVRFLPDSSLVAGRRVELLLGEADGRELLDTISSCVVSVEPGSAR